ncbi:MAG: AbgT family transporter [Micropepsaceae bacterium]
MTDITTTEKPGRLRRMLDAIERAGNKLPDPVTLFIISIGLLMVISALLAASGVGAVNPADGKPVAAVSLLHPDQIRRLFTELPQIFTSFPPLGVVLIMMIGVGVAERAGLFSAALSGLVKAVPKPLLTLTIVFAGCQASIASDAGYVVLIPLSAAVFAASGRNPIAGLSASFCGVAGGFTANLSVTTLDGLLSGLTQAGARLIDPAYEVAITSNWFIMAALVPVISLVGTFVCERIVEPRLNAGPAWVNPAQTAEDDTRAARERRGLRWAGSTLLVYAGFIAFLAWAPGHPLRDPQDGDFDPLLRGLIGVLFLMFLLMGIAYGVAAGTIRSDRDAVKMASQGVAEMGSYLVLAFFASVFVALFTWSNLGALMAISGAEFLKSIGAGGLPILIMVILIAMGTDLLIGSASAKWAILAPVLVPMLMLVGISPEATQAAYRLGDSTTNMITPFMTYFPLILILAQRYRPDFGIGSMIALMLPYTVSVFLASTTLFVIWYGFDLPLGPGVSSTYTVGR